jgi:hypothetical protein
VLAPGFADRVLSWLLAFGVAIAFARRPVCR